MFCPTFTVVPSFLHELDCIFARRWHAVVSDTDMPSRPVRLYLSSRVANRDQEGGQAPYDMRVVPTPLKPGVGVYHLQLSYLQYQGS